MYLRLVCTLALAAAIASVALATPIGAHCRMQAPSASADPNAPSGRLAAARALASEQPGIPPASVDLMACVLADMSSEMSVKPDAQTGEWVVSVPDAARLESVAAALAGAHAAYGSPSVAIEPERPSREEDRTACAGVSSGLAQHSIRTLAGDQERASRRNAADQAVADGADGGIARDAVDRTDADFSLRALCSRRISSAPAYGLTMHTAEVSIDMTLTPLGGSSGLKLLPVFATARSTTADGAMRQAERAALATASAVAASATCSQWLRAIEGRSPWVIEVVGGADSCAPVLLESRSGLRLVEHRAGIRSVLTGPAPAVRSLIDGPDGALVEHHRPGYARLRCGSAAPWRPRTWIAVTGSTFALACAWVLWRRSGGARAPAA